MEDDHDPDVLERAAQPAGLAAPHADRDRVGHPAERAVGHARGLERDDARRLEQVARRLAQDEALERRGQEQHGGGPVHAEGRYSVNPRDGLPEAPADGRGGLPARRHRLEVPRAGAAAGLHAPSDQERLRHGRAAHDARHLRLDPRAAGDRRGLRPLLVRRARRGEPPRARAPLGRPARCCRPRCCPCSPPPSPGPLSELVLGQPRDQDVPRRRARPVGLHEPRARLRPAARRGALAHLRGRLDDQRGDHDLLDDRPRRRARPGRLRPAARQLRRVGDRARRRAGPRARDVRQGSTAPSPRRCAR